LDWIGLDWIGLDEYKDKGIEHSNSSSNNNNNSTGGHGGKRSDNADKSDRGRTQRNPAYSDSISNLNSKRTPNREDYGENTRRRRYNRDNMDDNDDDNDNDNDRLFRTTTNDGSNSRDDNRYNNDRSSSRRRGASAASRYHRDNGEEEEDTDRYRDRNRNIRERTDSGYHSDDYDDSRRRDSRNRDASRRYEERSFRESSSNSNNNNNRSERRRRHSKDHYYTTSSSDDDHNDDDDDDETEVRNTNEPKEWPPSFKENGSAFVFDVRSAMFYEPLSDFFYDPKSKLYYGNKKCAYFRYDDKKEPPFVEVQKMTTEQVEEQQSSGGIAQEKVAPPPLKAAALSKPKIAIKFKTKKVKSSVSVSTLSSREAATATTVSISKAKQQQIANIGKWNEQQAEQKQQQGVVNPNPSAPLDAALLGQQGSSLSQTTPTPPKIKTTIKGEPICLVCKKKFPNLAKLRLHEKGSELHKKNLLKLEETRKKKKLATAAATAATGTKRKLGEAATAILAIDHSASTSTATTTTTASTSITVYTDRAEKRRQLHGADLGGPESLLRFEPLIPATPQQSLGQTPLRTDLLDDETNVGHQMLQKMGYNAEQQEKQKPNSSTNEHLRKEWDRIEAMAQKSVPRYR